MKRLLPVVLAVAALGLTAPPARAADPVPVIDGAPGYFCTSFDLCMDFSLDYLGVKTQTTSLARYWWQPQLQTTVVLGYYYGLSATYVSGGTLANGQPGAVTAFGIYDVVAGGPTMVFDSILSQPAGEHWGICTTNELQLLACTDAANGNPLEQGMLVGETVAFRFLSSDSLHASDFGGTGGDLGFRAHIQSYANACSLKPDSREGENDFLVDSPEKAGCGGTTVPEPMTMVLLASGLGGIALPVLRRLRRKDEET